MKIKIIYNYRINNLITVKMPCNDCQSNEGEFCFCELFAAILNENIVFENIIHVNNDIKN